MSLSFPDILLIAVKYFVHRICLFVSLTIQTSSSFTIPEIMCCFERDGGVRKSVSEFALPLVLCWKKDGNLRICTDFRWLNARTVKDAHPLPHQEDCLAALGGNLFFSTMDLTSGFYNIPLHEDN